MKSFNSMDVADHFFLILIMLLAAIQNLREKHVFDLKLDIQPVKLKKIICENKAHLIPTLSSL